MTTQTEEATRTTSLEQQIGRLEGGYDQLGRRVEDQTIATNKLRDETNANFAAQTAATDKLRADLTAKIDAHGESIRAEMHAQGESIRADLTAKIDAQGESLRAEIRSRFNTLLIVGTTVGAALFTATVGGFVAIFLWL